MGRKPLIIPVEVEKKLLTYGKTLFSNGKLLYGNIAWIEICKEMNNIVKPSSLYSIVSQNRYNILSNLKKNLFSQETFFGELQTNYVQDESDTDDSTTSNTECDIDSEHENNVFALDLEIPYDMYFKIKPVNVHYGDGNQKRKYCVLKPGTWTDIIFEEMYNKYKTPCCFVLKRCKIYPTSENMFLKIFAKCKDKNCQINIYDIAEKKPLEDEQN